MADPLWTWEGEVPVLPRRVIVAAPHPDDEVIGAGGILTALESVGVETCILAVTDGESSHALSSAISPPALRARRRRERADALQILGLRTEVRRARLPDGAVTEHVDDLTSVLTSMIDHSDDAVIAPCRHDGHPDHEATTRAAIEACRRSGAALWEVPIWAKVDQPDADSRPVPRSALVLSPLLIARKRAAVECFDSQLRPIGVGPFDGPVIHPDELDEMLNGREELWW